jgi:hypothetical protein
MNGCQSARSDLTDVPVAIILLGFRLDLRPYLSSFVQRHENDKWMELIGKGRIAENLILRVVNAVASNRRSPSAARIGTGRTQQWASS